MTLGSISWVFEVVGAFIGCEGVECLANCRADRINGSRGGLSEQVLELGKDLLDGVQVRRVFWQEESLAPTERMSWRTALLLWLATRRCRRGKDGQQNLLDIGAEACAVGRSLDEPWRIDPVMPKAMPSRPSTISNGSASSWWRILQAHRRAQKPQVAAARRLPLDHQECLPGRQWRPSRAA